MTGTHTAITGIERNSWPGMLPTRQLPKLQSGMTVGAKKGKGEWFGGEEGRAEPEAEGEAEGGAEGGAEREAEST